tara:strand:- start:1867 stop:2292 length:426 start_codon:yes stop_codon:yes gene_type:complete
MSHLTQPRNAPNLSIHALQRVDERLVGEEAQKVITAVRKASAKYGTQSLGIIAHDLGAQRGQAWGNTSNGDLVVVIVRNGQVKTVYLRRATQTFDLSVSRTDILVDMTGKVLSTPTRRNATPSRTNSSRNAPRDIFANRGN